MYMDNKRYTTFTKYRDLRRKFLERFTNPNPSGTALAQLLQLKQRRTGIQEYATKALTLPSPPVTNWQPRSKTSYIQRIIVQKTGVRHVSQRLDDQRTTRKKNSGRVFTPG